MSLRAEAPAEKQPSGPAPEPTPTPEAAQPPLLKVVREGTDVEIRARLKSETEMLISAYAPTLDNYCYLSLYDPEGSVDRWDADRLFTALESLNADHDKNVLLFLVTPGGKVEPAYQISKICKEFAKDKFVVTIPRAAKSAGTLIAIGADEIHMGRLGELGPIDPQLGDLPALGVKTALETIAGVCEKHPQSAETFARYLQRTVTIQQIGYCERVAESAVQYAERLLANKELAAGEAERIARQLVYEYKDHSFVIDYEEAQTRLGLYWIGRDSIEMGFAEKVHQLLDTVNLYLNIFKQQQLSVVGGLVEGVLILTKPA